MAQSTFQLKVMIIFGVLYLENMTTLLFSEVFPVLPDWPLILIMLKKQCALCFDTIGNGRPRRRSSVGGLLLCSKKNLPAEKLVMGLTSWLASLNWKQQVTFNSDLILIIVKLDVSETDPLALGSEWSRKHATREPPSKATIKIFNDEEKFEEYRDKMQEWNSMNKMLNCLFKSTNR